MLDHTGNWKRQFKIFFKNYCKTLNLLIQRLLRKLSSISRQSLVLSPHGNPMFPDNLKLCKVVFKEVTQSCATYSTEI